MITEEDARTMFPASFRRGRESALRDVTRSLLAYADVYQNYQARWFAGYLQQELGGESPYAKELARVNQSDPSC